MDKKFIKNISGNEFVTHEGLLNEFHNNGGKSIKTKMIRCDSEMIIFWAIAEGEKGTFYGHGDADDKNVNKQISIHKIRMAETRAVNRSLRLYNNIGMCSADEVTGDEKPLKEEPVENYACSECDTEISPKVAEFSKDKYGKLLCMKCQKKS